MTPSIAGDLTAGDLNARYDERGVLDVLWGDTVLAERVYFGVRDLDWNTVPLVPTSVTADSDTRSFEVVVAGRADGAGIGLEFTWTVRGTDDGFVRFEVHGRYLRDSLVNKVGLNVHHDMIQSRGASYVSSSSAGESRGTLPTGASGGRVIRDLFEPFDRLRTSTAGGSIDYRFGGDLFEMQDHRNWSDYNLKSYGTPLSEPFPVEHAEGESFEQWVEIHPAAPATPARSLHRVVERSRLPRAALPAIGTSLPTADRATRATALPSHALDWARTVGLEHVLSSHDTSDEGWLSALAHDAGVAASIGVPLDVRLFTVSSEAADAVTHASQIPGVRRAIVVPRDGHFEALTRTVTPSATPTPISLGAAATFAEFATARPALPAGWGAQIPVSPTFHVFDDESVMRNVRAHTDLALAARELFGDAPLALGPVTLIPEGGPYSRGVPSADPRQGAEFTAAWTLGSIVALMGLGAITVTYFEIDGPRGLHGTPTASLLGAILAGGAEVAYAPLETTWPFAVLVPAEHPTLVANLSRTTATIEIDGTHVSVDAYSLVEVD